MANLNCILLIFAVISFVHLTSSRSYNYNIGIILPTPSTPSTSPFLIGYDQALARVHNKTRPLLTSKNVSLTFTPFTLYMKDFDSFRSSRSLCHLLSTTPLVSLFAAPSVLDPSLEWKVTLTSAALDIPLFLLGQGQGQAKDRAIRLSPTLETWEKLLSSLVQSLRIPSIALLYERSDGLARLSGLLRRPHPTAVLRRVPPFLPVLKEVKSREIRHLLIDCSLESLKELVESVEQLQMTDYKFHYILTNLDIRTLDPTPFQNVNMNLTSFQIVSPESPFVKETVKDYYSTRNFSVGEWPGSNETLLTDTALAYDSVITLATALSRMGKFVSPKNLSCDEDKREPWKDGATLNNYITASELSGLTGTISFQGNLRSTMNMEIVRLGPQGWRKVGSFSEVLNLTEPSAFWDFGLNNATLLVTCVLEQPYVQLRQPPPNSNITYTGNARFEGFSIDLLKLIASLVGFNYILSPVPDGKYGSLDPDTGEWNGVIKQLTEKSVDLGIGALTITHAREIAIDFTKPFMHFGISILFRKPLSQPTGIFRFMQPLALEIWLSVGVSYLLVALTMFLLARFSPHEWSRTTTAMARHRARHSGKKNQFTFSNALWYPIGTLMQQGSDLNPKSAATRIVGGIWWFFSLVIVSSYTANLAAFLTVERLANPIESVKDLVEQGSVAYGSLDSGATMAYFRDSKIETYQKMWRIMESKKPSVFTKTYKEGVRRVLDGNYAFLMESTTIEYVIGENCNLTQIGGLLNSKGYGIALPKGSPWKDRISLAILQLQEIGVIRWYQDKWWNQSPGRCASSSKGKDETNRKQSLGVDSIGGVFLVLAVGLGLSVLVAIFEISWGKRKIPTEAEPDVAKCPISCPCDRCENWDCSCAATRRRNAVEGYECEECGRVPTPPPPPVMTRRQLYESDIGVRDDLVESFAFSPAYDESYGDYGERICNSLSTRCDRSTAGLRNRLVK